MNENVTQLKDRDLWFDGDSCVSPDELLSLIASGSTKNVMVKELTDDICQFNQFVSPDEQIKIKTECREFDYSWNIPEEYMNLNVIEYIKEKLYDEIIKMDIEDNETKITIYANRVSKELNLYKSMGLLKILSVIIYIINTLEENSIVWGVGRGSSVHSYVMYLIGVHDVDSIEFELDVEDFLRTE